MGGAQSALASQAVHSQAAYTAAGAGAASQVTKGDSGRYRFTYEHGDNHLSIGGRASGDNVSAEYCILPTDWARPGVDVVRRSGVVPQIRVTRRASPCLIQECVVVR